MAFYSNFHHSNHPNFKQPYTNRPNRRSDGRGHGSGGGGGDGYNSYENSNNSMSSNTLWMGNIDGTMDEDFIKFAFDSFSINVSNIKIIRNKENGLPVGYGFVTFDDRDTAQHVLEQLNGKKIPNVEDDKRFFLKRANRTPQRLSIFVGNLTPDVNDGILLSAFKSCYPSVISAKVITSDGQSKGFGFVSFEKEYEYYNALNQQNMMLGDNPISVSKARHNNANKMGSNPRYQQQDNSNIRSRRYY